MPGEHRPLTQVGNSLLTVAENSVQYSSSTSSDIQVPRKRALEDQSSFFSSDSVSQSKDGGKIAKLGKEKIERPIGTFSQVSYNELMTRDQAGPAIIGSDNSEECNFVAIKRVKKVDNSLVHRIPSFNSDQLVEIRDMYQDNDDVVIIYEQMDVSLRHITGLLQGPLKAFQIAAICKEVLDGLSYLHKELSHYHGALSCGTILLNLEGRVKIANIGESFINGRRLTPESERNDVCSLGSVMMELMEPETFILDPHSTALKNADKWKDNFGIKDFLAATQDSSLEKLKNAGFRSSLANSVYLADKTKNDFLPKKPISKCLRSHVLCAVIAAKIGWDLLSLP